MKAKARLIGDSEAFRAAMATIDKVAESDLPVLILGESGTGKELVARSLHRNSPRNREPFVALNLAALPASLVEDELFGHVPGAYTGANSARSGRFARANGGTLFLDEIGDVPSGVQVKLLRALEEGVIEPLGAELETPVNVRVIAATHRDLRSLTNRGTFRQDLLFRLSVVTVELPPLRARAGDIELLAKHFATAEMEKLAPCDLTPGAIRKLNSYPWPGNVRELENAILRARALAAEPRLDADNFNFLFEERPGRAAEIATLAIRYGLNVAEMEAAMLDEALRISNQNGSEAARRLGLSRRSVEYRLSKKRAE